MKLVRSTLLGLYINILMVILLSVFFFRELINNNSGNWVQWLLYGLFVASSISNAILAVKNIMNAYKLYKNIEHNSLREYMKALKLWAIPYFVINFAIYFLLFGFFFAASRGIFIFTPIPLFFLIPIFLTYLTVLFTSCYGIAFATIMHKEKRFSIRKLLFHILMQLCFVLDVVDTIILLMKYKEEQVNE